MHNFISSRKSVRAVLDPTAPFNGDECLVNTEQKHTKRNAWLLLTQWLTETSIQRVQKSHNSFCPIVLAHNVWVFSNVQIGIIRISKTMSKFVFVWRLHFTSRNFFRGNHFNFHTEFKIDIGMSAFKMGKIGEILIIIGNTFCNRDILRGNVKYFHEFWAQRYVYVIPFATLAHLIAPAPNAGPTQVF